MAGDKADEEVDTDGEEDDLKRKGFWSHSGPGDPGFRELPRFWAFRILKLWNSFSGPRILEFRIPEILSF